MMKKIGLTIFSACFALLLYCPDIVHALNVGTNINVCVGGATNTLNIIDPDVPNIDFTVSTQPFYYYNVMIQKWNPSSRTWDGIYDSNVLDPSTLIPPGTAPGTYTYFVPRGTLPVDGGSYLANVRVYYNGDWTSFAWAIFVLNPRDGICGTANTNSFCPIPTVDFHTFPAYPNLCSVYNQLYPPANYLSGTGAEGTTWNWSCSGSSGGGITKPCQADVPVVATPNCGTIMGTRICPGSTVTDSTPGLCTIFDPSSPPHVTGDGVTTPWSWTCTAGCNVIAKDAHCTKFRTETIIPTCGEASNQNYCYEGTGISASDTSKLCSPSSMFEAGSLKTNYTDWTWKCNGICPTSEVACSAGNSRSCGWKETN